MTAPKRLVDGRRTAYPVLPKDCKHCGNPLVRREKERPIEYRDRKFCDYRCALQYRMDEIRKSQPPRFCGNANCRKLLVPHPIEPNPRFLERKTCSKECAAEMRLQSNMSHGVPPVDRDVRPAPLDGPDFSSQNIRFKPDVRRLNRPSHNYSISGSSMGWTSSTSGEGAV